MRISSRPTNGVILRIDLHTTDEVDLISCMAGTCPVDPETRSECSGCPSLRRKLHRRAREVLNEQSRNDRVDSD